MEKDPVCQMSVDEKKTKFRSTYQGKNFYFCSNICKTAFDKAPQNYATKSLPFHERSVLV
ncbi:YHS domain-containing protein [Candidatus Bathyarchaeota archaeon]|nr:MAG: YHS domain-containing protein [Candidatus Bathyarchaeota archaeon]